MKKRVNLGILLFGIFTMLICVGLGQFPIERECIPTKHYLELKKQKEISDDLTMRQAHKIKYYETNCQIPKY